MLDLIALLDLDGTTADYDGAMRSALQTLASPDEPAFESFTDETRPAWLEARRRLVSMQPGFWKNLKRLPAGFIVVDILRAEGFTIQVLTKGPATKPMAWMEKLEWCREHLPGADVTITENKSTSYGRILVDDWPPYYQGWLAHRPRGVVIVPAQPWNEGAESCDPARIYRYDIARGITAYEELCRIIRAVRARQPEELIDIRKIIG